MSREFEIRREIELPATPDEVWEAVATPEGNEAWLFPGLLDPEQAQVYERPHRFLLRMEGEDGWFNSIEDIIEARGGGTTVLRYVHSGIFTEDWDNQYDAADKHTDFYLHTLGEYLRHFKGRRATYVGGGPDGILAPESSSQAGSLDRLKRALGLDAGASAGDTVRLDVDGLEPQDAVVDYGTPHFLGIRTGDALYRFFARGAWGEPTGMSAHLFAEDADEQRTAKAWSAWMNGVFA
jgi:hypothetical protein